VLHEEPPARDRADPNATAHHHHAMMIRAGAPPVVLTAA
jgi:hypothetical protein